MLPTGHSFRPMFLPYIYLIRTARMYLAQHQWYLHLPNLRHLRHAIPNIGRHHHITFTKHAQITAPE